MHCTFLAGFKNLLASQPCTLLSNPKNSERFHFSPVYSDEFETEYQRFREWNSVGIGLISKYIEYCLGQTYYKTHECVTDFSDKLPRQHSASDHLCFFYITFPNPDQYVPTNKM